MFTGVFTALVTPFDRQGDVDEKALRAIVENQINSGIHGLVPVGSTGESPTVDHRENLKVIEIVLDQAKGRVPVIAGTGSNSTAEALEMTKKAAALGAKASLQVAPYYNKPNQEGFYRHYMSLADGVNLPLIIYNIPGRTAKNVEADTILKLADHPNIVGVKESSGNLAQVMEILAAGKKDFAVLSGDDNWTLPVMALGGHGIVSVVSHLIPKSMVALYEALVKKDLSAARSIHYEILPLCKAMFVDTNPIPVKYALSRLGLIEEVYRLPLCPLDEKLKAEVDRVLKNFGLLK